MHPFQLHDSNYRTTTPEKLGDLPRSRRDSQSLKQEAMRKVVNWIRMKAQGQYELVKCQYMSGDKQKNSDSQIVLAIRPASNSNNDVGESIMKFLSNLFSTLIDRTEFQDMEIWYTQMEGYSCVLKWNLVEELLRPIEQQSPTNTNSGSRKSFHTRLLTNSQPTGFTPKKSASAQQELGSPFKESQSSGSDESLSSSIEKKQSSSIEEKKCFLSLDEQLYNLAEIYRQFLQSREVSNNVDLEFFFKERTDMWIQLRQIFHSQDPNINQTIRDNLIKHCLTISDIDQELKLQRQRYATEAIPALYEYVLKEQAKYCVAVSGVIHFSQYLLCSDYSIAYDPSHVVYLKSHTIRLLITPRLLCNTKEIPLKLTGKLQFQLGKEDYARLVSSEGINTNRTYFIELHISALEKLAPMLEKLTITDDTFPSLVTSYVEHTVVTIFGFNVLYDVLSKVQIEYAKSFNPTATDHFVAALKELIFIYQHFKEALVSDTKLRATLIEKYGDQFNAVAVQLDGEFRFNCFSIYLDMHPKDQVTVFRMFNWVDPEAIESRYNLMFDYFEQQSISGLNSFDIATCYSNLLSLWRTTHDYFLTKEGRYTVIVPKMMNACKLALNFPYSVTFTQHFTSEDHNTQTVSGELSVIKIQLVPHPQTVTNDYLIELYVNFQSLFNIAPEGVNADHEAHYLVLTPEQLDHMNQVQLPDELLHHLDLYEGLLKDSASQKVHIDNENAQLKSAMLSGLATIYERFIQFSNRFDSDEIFKSSLTATLGNSVLDDNIPLACFIVYLQNVPYYTNMIREIFSDNTMLDRCKKYLELEITRSKNDERTRRLQMLLAVVIECHASFSAS